MEVYYFSGANCKPCKTMSPVVDTLILEGKNIIKFEVEKDYLKAMEFNITSVPTFIKLTSLFEEAKRHVGTINIGDLREFIL